ncbi:leucine-rich repeat-containing protein 43-like isoform X2 [Trachinotus anak]|uniref:leucine-rich repeat-containing protein 43-like isoform X2 n=1 Tax=Trachinotus anak TaxID=443729 RepID=UPI0039F16DDF
MSSNTLSAVLEKQIRHLCLTDFPCGDGSWRKTKDSPDAAETEETDSLLDLLSCPHSPWRHDVSWSPQAPALRKLAVLSPDGLHTDFIYNYFTTLHIVDKGVSVIDKGLLRFSKLKELVLSANKISEIPSENLPSTLKILELRANLLSALTSLTRPPPPHLQYLSLSSNSLGHHEDISNLTGRHWPQLVCLDLSDCEFQDQKALLSALSTLTCLKTLVLEGNPFTLAPSYPGLTVDSLPQLSCLDTSWISPEERRCFQGLAKMSDLIVDHASATVSVRRMKGIPDPSMSADENAPEFPVVTYNYFIAYEFLSHHIPVNLEADSESKFDTAHVTNDGSSDADQQSKNCEIEASKQDNGVLIVNTQETCHAAAHVSRHSTSKVTWSEFMDFSDTQKYIVSDLGGLKKFLNQGLYLRIEEEKVQKISLQSNLVLLKTSLKTKRRNLSQSWSRTPPSEEALALSTFPCKAWSKEIIRSTSSVTLVPCAQRLKWKLRLHLKRIWERRSKRTRRQRTRNQNAEEAVVQGRRILHLQKAKERRTARWMCTQTTLCLPNWNQ